MADEQKGVEDTVKTDGDKNAEKSTSEQAPASKDDDDQVQTELAAPKDEKISQWKEEFHLIADVSGHITKTDLETYWQKKNRNPTEDDINAVLQAVQMADTDGDGKISFEEFVEIQKQAEQQPFYSADIKDELLDALKAYDTNGDNVISKEELKAILSGYDDEELDELIANADLDGDGKLSIPELAKLMTDCF